MFLANKMVSWDDQVIGKVYAELTFLCSIDYRIDKDQHRRLVFQQGEGQYTNIIIVWWPRRTLPHAVAHTVAGRLKVTVGR